MRDGVSREGRACLQMRAGRNIPPAPARRFRPPGDMMYQTEKRVEGSVRRANEGCHAALRTILRQEPSICGACGTDCVGRLFPATLSTGTVLCTPAQNASLEQSGRTPVPMPRAAGRRTGGPSCPLRRKGRADCIQKSGGVAAHAGGSSGSARMRSHFGDRVRTRPGTVGTARCRTGSIARSGRGADVSGSLSGIDRPQSPARAPADAMRDGADRQPGVPGRWVVRRRTAKGFLLRAAQPQGLRASGYGSATGGVPRHIGPPQAQQEFEGRFRRVVRSR